MRDHLEPGPIVTRKPQVGFYADMPAIGVEADASLEEIVARAAATHARYLVVDERYTAALIPALRPLLDPKEAPASLRAVHADLTTFPGGRIVIYEFSRGESR